MTARSRVLAIVLVACACLIPAASASQAPAATGLLTFVLGPASPAIAACLPDAQAQVTIIPNPLNDTLTIHATGLPSFAAFDLYATALPHAPFGLSWPLSLLNADAQGEADAQVQATLLQASGVSTAPSAATHLVLFFDNPRDADACFGGAASTTPYNATHSAGPAVLATTGYPDNAGPLQQSAFDRPGLGISTPGGGRSLSSQPVTFTVTCSHPDGWTAIRFVDFRLTLNGAVHFWGRLDRPAKRFFVYDPTTHHWLGGKQPGARVVLTTLDTQMIVGDSAVIGSQGTTGSVRWALAFTSAAHGLTFQQSVQVTDMRNQSSGWNPSGTWSVG